MAIGYFGTVVVLDLVSVDSEWPYAGFRVLSRGTHVVNFFEEPK